MQKLKFLKPALCLVVITVGTALLLSLVNFITKDRIAENELEEKRAAIEAIFPDLADFDKASMENPPQSVNEVGIVRNGSHEKIGYYVEISPMGFKDAISMIVGFDADEKIIRAICLSSSETAGVGTKATDASYLDKYAGHTIDNASSVDTITGATISSKAVREGIKSACEAVEIIKGVK